MGKLRRISKTRHERSWGDAKAKGTNRTRSYERDRPLSEYTFECENCGKRCKRIVIPGPMLPRYCSDDCRAEVRRQQTRDRVRRFREARRQEKARQSSEQ